MLVVWVLFCFSHATASKFLKPEIPCSFGDSMLIPMLVPAIFTSALIFGPAFVIVFALCILLVVRFPSLKTWIGAAMVVVGFVEMSSVPDWVLVLLLIGFSTSIIGIAVVSSALFSDRRRGVAGLVLVVLGVLGIFAFALGFLSANFWTYAFLIIVLAFGTAGVAVLLPEQRRAKIGLIVLALGFVAILVGLATSFVALTFFVGLVVVFVAIPIVVSGLRYWTFNRAGGNTIQRLKKGLYVLLAVVILSSTVVVSLRATNVLREELYDQWTLTTAADTTVQGVVREIHLNYEVDNNGYSYHVFPALIIVTVTEVLKADSIWMNLSEAEAYWVNQNMTIGYDRTDVPNLVVGQQVEASGYYDLLIEDQTSFSSKLVISAKIDGSYIMSLQG